MRAALSLTTLAVGDVLPQYPWEALEARMVPTIFLMLQHTQAPLNMRSHGVFAVIFEAYPDETFELFPRYIELALACYPALTQAGSVASGTAGLEAATGILARTLSDDHASLEWTLQQIRGRCDALMPLAEADVRQPTQSRAS